MINNILDNDYAAIFIVQLNAILNYTGQTINSTIKLGFLYGGHIIMNISTGVTSIRGFRGSGVVDYTSVNDSYAILLDYDYNYIYEDIINKFTFNIKNLTDIYSISDIGATMLRVYSDLSFNQNLNNFVNFNVTNMSLAYSTFIHYRGKIGEFNCNCGTVTINYSIPGPSNYDGFIMVNSPRGINFNVGTLYSNVLIFRLINDSDPVKENYIAGQYTVNREGPSVILCSRTIIRLGVCNLVSINTPAITNDSSFYPTTIYYSNNSSTSSPTFDPLNPNIPTLINYSNTIS